MSLARLKRLQRLEARRPSERPWQDPFDLCMHLWAAFEAETAATKAGREFNRLIEYGPDREVVVLAIREADRMHARLAAERA